MKYICKYTYENLSASASASASPFLKANYFSSLVEDIEGLLEKWNHGGFYNDTDNDIWGYFWKKEPVFVVDIESISLEEVKDFIEDKRTIYPFPALAGLDLNRVIESIFSARVLTKRGREDISKDYPVINEQTTQEAFERAELKREKAEITGILERNEHHFNNGGPIPPKDYQKIMEIKKQYSSYFDSDSGNSTVKEGLEDIKGYLDDELSTLSSSTPASIQMSKALEEIPESSNKRLKQDAETRSLAETEQLSSKDKGKQVETGSLASKGKGKQVEIEIKPSEVKEVESESLTSKGKQVETETKPSKGKGKEIETETKPKDGPSDTPASGPSGTPTIGPSDTPSDRSPDRSSNPPASDPSNFHYEVVKKEAGGINLSGEEKLSDELLIDPWANFPLPVSLPTEEIAGNSWIDILVNIFP